MRDLLRNSLRLIGAMTVALLLPPAQAEERTVNFYNWSNYMAPGVLEDFTKETEQQNLPGSTAEYPNWRHKTRFPRRCN